MPDDILNRPLQDLRLSVIDRCNFRCPYCMPEKDCLDAYSFLKQEEWLSFGEIRRIVGIFAQLGVRKIRITGGEPLLRPNVSQLIQSLSVTPGIDDVALTTNGALLAKYVKDLKQAGLRRVTVSLDTLDPELFHKMNGKKGSLEQVLGGIEAADKAGFDCIKINVVVLKGVNDHHIIDLVKYFRGRKPILRFIEYMDAGNCNRWIPESVMSAVEIRDLINEEFPLEPLKANYYGEVASRYRFLDGSGEVGFIPSISQPFCYSCTRARLSPNGKLFTCLFSSKGLDLYKPLHAGCSDEELSAIIKAAWNKREDRYSELRTHPTTQSIATPKRKVEMFQIGG